MHGSPTAYHPLPQPDYLACTCNFTIDSRHTDSHVIRFPLRIERLTLAKPLGYIGQASAVIITVLNPG